MPQAKPQAIHTRASSHRAERRRKAGISPNVQIPRSVPIVHSPLPAQRSADGRHVALHHRPRTPPEMCVRVGWAPQAPKRVLPRAAGCARGGRRWRPMTSRADVRARGSVQSRTAVCAVMGCGARAWERGPAASPRHPSCCRRGPTDAGKANSGWRLAWEITFPLSASGSWVPPSLPAPLHPALPCAAAGVGTSPSPSDDGFARAPRRRSGRRVRARREQAPPRGRVAAAARRGEGPAGRVCPGVYAGPVHAGPPRCRAAKPP